MLTKLFFALTLFLISAPLGSTQDLWLHRSGGDLTTFNVMGCGVTQQTNVATSLTDIAFAPDGKLYGIRSNGNLYEVNEASGNTNLLVNLDNNGTYVALNCDVNYNLYAADTEGDIYRYNIPTGTSTYLGNCGFTAGGDLGFANGELYLGAVEGLVRIDLTDVTQSSLYLPWDNPGAIWGMFTDADDCGNSTMYVLDNRNPCQLYTVDFQTLSFDAYCVLNNQFFGGASKNAFKASNSLTIENVEIENVDCVPNGTIHLEVKGGSAPYRYSVNNGVDFNNTGSFNNLAMGDYMILVLDKNDCEARENITIGASDFTIDPIIEPARCGKNNGVIDFNSSNGLAAYSYSIDGGATFSSTAIFDNLAPGNYQLVAKDALDCTKMETAMVSIDNNELQLNPIEVEFVGCDRPAQVLISFQNAAEPVEFTLNGVVIPAANFLELPDGQYTLRIRDSQDCEDEREFEVDINCEVLVPSAIVPNSTNGNDKLRLLYYQPLDIRFYYVFNRWGELIYEAKNFKSESELSWWNGRYKDGSVLTGLYFYNIGYTKTGGGNGVKTGATLVVE